MAPRGKTKGGKDEIQEQSTGMVKESWLYGRGCRYRTFHAYAGIRRFPRQEVRSSFVPHPCDGDTALDVYAVKFKELVAAKTGGVVEIQVFPNGQLGQEREIVQQVQQGLCDMMASGTAIWGTVAPKIQILDLPVPVPGLRSHPQEHGRRGRAGAEQVRRGADRGPAPGVLRLVRLPERRDPQQGSEEHRRHERPEAPHPPVADLRQGDRADGGEPDADGVRRDLHLAADQRHRRLRARRQHHAHAEVLRGDEVLRPHAAHQRRPGDRAPRPRASTRCRRI